MIASDEAAKQVVALLLDASGAIDQSVAEVKQRGTEEELAAYSKVAGGILGKILIEALNPIFKQHPELVPPELASGYQSKS